MHLRISSLRALFLLLALLGSASAPVSAQVRRVPATPASVSDSQSPRAQLADLRDILLHGEQLEQRRHWSEALNHYEQAIRQHPDRQELEQRLDLARLHVDVARRYSDQSFLRSVRAMNRKAALDLYGEVLAKIHSHYVQVPNWRGLVARGVNALDVALAEPPFRDQIARDAQARLGAFRKELRGEFQARTIQDRNQARIFVARVADSARDRLGVSPAAVIAEFSCAAAGALDEYSSYLTGNELDEVFSQIEGNFVGLGVELKTEQGALIVVDVIPGGPADEAGIAAGDAIVAVNGQQTADVSADAAADLLKGEEGTSVEIELSSANGESRMARVARRRVDVPSVDRTRILDPDAHVGYFRLTSFQKTTTRDVDNALWHLYRQGMRSLIMDLRGNPGGLLNASVEVADRFLDKGIIVSTRGRNREETFDYVAHAEGTWRVPLVVLIDGDSASASEIFAGAIHDHRRGTIVGQRSYGKGSVQGIFPLDSHLAGIRLTTAKFFSPSGQPISRRGVQPDVPVTLAAKPVDGKLAFEDDPMLRAALAAAKEPRTK